MSRLQIQMPGQAERTVSQLYKDLERRIAVAPSGNCPVELTAPSCGYVWHRAAANASPAAWA